MGGLLQQGFDVGTSIAEFVVGGYVDLVTDIGGLLTIQMPLEKGTCVMRRTLKVVALQLPIGDTD
jgi:hypothetical protein